MHGWPLGPAAALQFAAPAVFDPASQRYFAAVTLAGALAATQLLSWPADLPAGPLERSAERTSLPRPVHSLHPVADAAARGQHGERDTQVHTAGSDKATALPSTTDASAVGADAAAGRSLGGASTSGRDERAGACVFIVHSDGSVALDATYAGGRSGGPGAQGSPGRRVASAAVDRGRLAVVCADADGSTHVAFHSAQARCCVLSLSNACRVSLKVVRRSEWDWLLLRTAVCSYSASCRDCHCSSSGMIARCVLAGIIIYRSMSPGGTGLVRCCGHEWEGLHLPGFGVGPLQGLEVRQWGPVALERPAEGAAVLAAALDGHVLALLWSEGTLQCLRVALSPGKQATLRQQVGRRFNSMHVSYPAGCNK